MLYCCNKDMISQNWINQEDFTRSGKEKRPVCCLSLPDKSEYALFIANYRTELKFIIYNYGAELLFWAVISNYCGRVSQDKKPEMLGKSKGNWARQEERNFTFCLTLMKPHMSRAIEIHSCRKHYSQINFIYCTNIQPPLCKNCYHSNIYLQRPQHISHVSYCFLVIVSFHWITS